MAKRPGVVTTGTARDLAEHDGGYSANGESQHSRQVAHANLRLGEGKRTSGRLIREQDGALAKLKYQASIEMDPAKLAKIIKNIGIKSAFVAKLKGQYANEHPNETASATGQTRQGTKPGHLSPARSNRETWNWTEVETIPGEFEGDFD
jgi:hypothetical protein